MFISIEIFYNIDNLEDYSISDEFWFVHSIAWDDLDHLIFKALIWVLFEAIYLISYGIDDIESG